MTFMRNMMRDNMWVIKLGGSLLGSEELKRWLDIVERLGDGKVIIVPGGGVFADAVRTSQEMSGINDEVAHIMAVMAMDQFGVLMTGLNSKLVTAASELELAERGWQHRGIIWLPSKMVCADEDIPTHWDMTSDSLAAWLASKVNAEHLILVKSKQPNVKCMSSQELKEAGLVDSSLTDFISDAEFKTWLIDKTHHTFFEHSLSTELLEQHALEVCSA